MKYGIFGKELDLTLSLVLQDMTLMNLSRLITHPEIFIQPVPQEVLDEESDEPELILESHLQVGLSLTNALELIQGQVETAAELVNQKLDSIRNKILRANMILTVFTVCLTMYSVVGSIFGMNLPIPRIDDPDAFYDVVFGTLGGCVALFVLILIVLWSTETIPNPGVRAFAG